MVRDRNRYSRWALAASAAAATAICNFVTISLFGLHEPSGFMSPYTGYIPRIASVGFVVGLIACGPGALILAKIAIWDINRRPYLGGRVLAELAVIVGWLSLALESGLAILTLALHLSGAFDGA